MSNRFSVPEDSPPPSTPAKNSVNGSSRHRYADEPSTTPAGPPPSSGASFTPAGAPSASYLGSSIMRAVTTQKPSKIGMQNSGISSKNMFAHKKSNSPLGRSIRGSKAHQPSRLSKQYAVDDNDDGEDGGAETRPRNQQGTFGMRYESSYDGDDAEGDDEDADGEEEEQEPDDAMDYGADEHSEEGGDMWLDMPQGLPTRPDLAIDDTDLMMFATPAANDRIRKEAEDLFRATARRSGSRRQQEFKFAALAKDLYNQLGCASIVESQDLILKTEGIVSSLYEEGIGTADDEEKLDSSLATAAVSLASLWEAYASRLPQSDEEHAAEIGPGPRASPFEKANYLATLALRLHHTRLVHQEPARTEPLPGTLFNWLSNYHNLYTSQMEEVVAHRPSPAVHAMFWQTAFIALLRGNVADAQKLLRGAGWEHVRDGRGGKRAYEGRALANVQQAARDTCEMLQSCPGISGNWDIWSSDWTLFRIRANGALDQLRRFAEGTDRPADDSDFSDSVRGRDSMTGMARKAESLVPWEIYENLQIVFEIVLGSQNAIAGAAQDWCEATIGLFGWWDEGKSDKTAAVSHSQSLILASQASGTEGYLDRLARAFHTATEHDFHFNSLNPVEVGMACVFEGNANGVIGILRSWSLPIASAVAELASLGGWLPPHQPSPLLGMGDLDMEDLEVLGVDSGSPDEADGIRDATLILYAQNLANIKELSTVKSSGRFTVEGWELAVQVLGRMDSPERSEETVGELLRAVLEDIDADSGPTVDKVWKLLNELGMITFAEDTAETFGDILARESHRYGDAMRYYALAHRPNKVREVMNLLISYSLIQSMAYPPTDKLDDQLRRLLSERNATLEEFAKQDLEAAELVGKMLSGYATLRKFYNLRDSGGAGATIPFARRQQAAAALTSVIAAADDSIRGGLYDPSRDAVVSEDFLLALLGEALVFVNNGAGGARNEVIRPPAITLDQIDILLKAVEDLQSIGTRVATACEEFLAVVLASAPGLKGSTPADLMRKSTSGLSGGSSGSGSYVMSGSSMLASKLHRSISAGWEGEKPLGEVKRGWDWRAGVTASTTGEEIMQKLRVGLTKDLAKLWLEEADSALL